MTVTKKSHATHIHDKYKLYLSENNQKFFFPNTTIKLSIHGKFLTLLRILYLNKFASLEIISVFSEDRPRDFSITHVVLFLSFPDSRWQPVCRPLDG